MVIMGIDIGTTNTKVGLFKTDGTQVAVSARPTVTHKTPDGIHYYDPEEMWDSIAAAMQEVAAASAEPVASIGITSMAESGLLVDRASGAARSLFMPWFDTCSGPQAARIAAEADLYERFCAAGLHSSFKLGLPKLLWLLERDSAAADGAVWLSASGYIAYRLTGRMAFDYSLAARTFAFDINRKQWDAEWIRHFGVSPDVYPEALPAGTPLGRMLPELAGAAGLTGELQVAIAGHDHVAASLAVGAVTPDAVYDSMGTAETLVGTLQTRPLGRREYEAGLSFGVHVAPGRMFWMGGNSSSGGSVEWLRGILGEPELSYADVLRLLADVSPEPTGMLYFPYLSGSGAPQPDAGAAASIIGLRKSHGKGEMLKAILEGTAYQLQAIRAEGEHIAGQPIDRLIVVGGGVRNPVWLQVKADILGAGLTLPPVDEASLLGAALSAGAGAGVYGSVDEAAAVSAGLKPRLIEPDARRHAVYRQLYEQGYAALLQPLRRYFKQANALQV